MPLTDPKFTEAAYRAAELQRLSDAAQWEMKSQAIAMGFVVAPLPWLGTQQDFIFYPTVNPVR